MMKVLYIPVLAMLLAGAALANTALGPNETLSFEKGKAGLTTESKKQLSALVNKARESGEVDEFHVAVWSDNPAPREGEELGKADRTLAERRTQAIRTYLKTLNVNDVDTFNMAEKASWVSRLFQTDGAELKSEVGRGGDAATSREEFDVYKKDGGVSKAVIVAVLKRP